MTHERAKAALASYFSSQARWRWGVAQDWPDDDRNLRSSEALEQLSEFVQYEYRGDERLTALAVLVDEWPEGFFSGGKDADHLTSRFGFDRPEPFAQERYTMFVDNVIDAVLSGQTQVEADELEKHLEFEDG